MLVQSLAKTEGPWRLLREGFPLPSVLDVHQDPLSHLCFPDSWRPAIISALKPLCRPETWIGDKADIAIMCENAQTLLAEIGDGCEFEPPHLNWYLDASFVGGNWDAAVFNNFLTGSFGEGDPFNTYTLVIWGDGESGVDVTITARDWDSGEPVGGVFDLILVTNEVDPAGQTYVITTKDCLGNEVVDTNFTPREYSGTFQWVHFLTGNQSTFIIKFRIHQDWICTVA